MLKQRIEQDLKKALLGGDKSRVSTLRVLKSAILNVEVAKGVREAGLNDEDIISILSKEAKKRQETAELYQKAGEIERAKAELAEKLIIEDYLPRQLSDEELKSIVEEVIVNTGASSLREMGEVIGEVKKRAGASADGGRIARLVKEGLVD